MRDGFRDYRRARWSSVPDDIKRFWRRRGFKTLRVIVKLWREQFDRGGAEEVSRMYENSLTELDHRPTMPGMNPDELRERREALEMTQGQLARELGVDLMTVSRWERAQRAIPPFLGLALETIERNNKPKRKTAGSGAKK